MLRGKIEGLQWELIEETPWRDRAKASSTGSAPDLLRSESLRMDETAPAASSALRSKESPSPPVSEPFLFNSSVGLVTSQATWALLGLSSKKARLGLSS